MKTEDSVEMKSISKETHPHEVFLPIRSRILSLPDDTLVHVFSFLSKRIDGPNLACTCSKMLGFVCAWLLSQHSKYWRRFINSRMLSAYLCGSRNKSM